MTKLCAHFSRMAIESLEMGQHRAALISIRDPGSARPKLGSQFLDILELEFHDLTDTADAIATRLIAIDDEQREKYRRELREPTAAHAQQIAAFIRRHPDDSIFVHCEAGISRSAAVCEVLCLLGWEYHRSVASPYAMGYDREHANPLLLRLLKAEFPELLPTGASVTDL